MKRSIKITTTSIFLIALFLSIGMFVSLGIREKNNSYVSFSVNGHSTEVNVDEIIDNIDSSNYYQIDQRDDGTDGGTEDGGTGDGGTEDGGTGDGGDNDSITSLEADWITIAFMNSALTGSMDGISNATEGSLFSSTFTTSDMLRDGFINDYNALYTDLVEIKLYYLTTGAIDGAIMFDDYLRELDPELLWATQDFILAGYNTIFEAKNNTDGNDFNQLLSALGEELEYKEDIVNFMYVYAWLWQEHWSITFDYYLTQYLVELKPTLAWELTIPKITDISAAIRQEIESWKGSTVNAAAWNTYVIDDIYIDGDEEATLSDPTLNPDTLTSFSGITYEGTGISNADSNLWSYNEIFNYYDSVGTGNPDYTFGVTNYLNSANGDSTPYVNENDEIFLENEDGGASVVTNTLLYPYIFAENYDGFEADSWTYSLSAYETNPNEFYLTGNQNDYVNIFDNWALVADNTADYVQLLLIYSIYNSSTAADSIIGNAYDTWNNDGFYITLSGSYEDKYGSLIDQRLQEKD